jgi:F-type H+-transporting ATPase subunit delta
LTSQQLISGVAQRYARSLFALAQDTGKIDVVAAELTSLQKALDESADFKAFVNSPVIPAQQQVESLKKLFAKFGVSSLTANFVQLLAQNRRLNLLRETIIAYRRLLDESKGVTSAEVISAEPLSENQSRALKEALKSATGKNVTLDPHIDQSLLGGLIVHLGSRMLDTSLKTKLSSLKVALKGTA